MSFDRQQKSTRTVIIMKDLIVSELEKNEAEYNVRILLAEESGSRARGFASPSTQTAEKNKHLAKLIQVASDVELPAKSVSDRCIDVYISRHVFATRWLQ